MLYTSILGTAVLLAAGADAHGAVTSYIIAGKTYQGSVAHSTRLLLATSVANYEKLGILAFLPPTLATSSNVNGPTTIL